MRMHLHTVQNEILVGFLSLIFTVDYLCSKFQSELFLVLLSVYNATTSIWSLFSDLFSVRGLNIVSSSK